MSFLCPSIVFVLAGLCQGGFKQVKTKYLGTQDLPTTIYFDTEQDILKDLSKEKEVILFKENQEKIISTFPILKEWTIQNPSKIIQHPAEWDNLLKVCQYFKQTPVPNAFSNGRWKIHASRSAND